jgi:hypothetical protein
MRGDAKAVERGGLESFEGEQVERALKEIALTRTLNGRCGHNHQRLI